MQPIKLFFSAVVTLLFSFGAKAQVSDARHPAFHSINSVALLNGSEKASWQLQTIEGIGYKNWFAGLGAAIDYYRYRTIPLFLDLRHHFGKTKNKVFVYADAGVAAPWVTKKEKVTYAPSDKFKAGLYYDLGAGYQLALGKRHALLLTAGFSRVNLKEDVAFAYYIDYYPSPANSENLNRYTYKLNRLIIKLGFSL